MTLELERPLRYPDTGSAPLMEKRARWLVLLGFVLPGSAQLLAGNRKLGRVGLGATVLVIVVGLATIAGLLWARETTLSILLNPLVLLGVQIVIVVYAVLWLILGFDTLRLTRLVRLSPGWRVPVAALSVIVTLVPVGAAAWAATTIQAARGAITDIFINDAPAVAAVDGRYNILLLGVDAGEDREGLRPDSISLVSIDAETGQSTIIGLNRYLVGMPFRESSPMHDIFPESFCSLPNNYIGDGYCFTMGHLNALYTELEDSGSPSYEGLYPNARSQGSSPGIEATKDAVEGATGLEVQFYVMVDMSGFSSIVDALGGVEINVRERLPIGGLPDEYTGELVGVVGWIEPGLQRMDGYTAEWYARSRFGSGTGDYDRMERQRELQTAILAQMSPSNVLLRFQEVAASGASVVKTDIPDSMLGRFVDLATKAKNHVPVTVELIPPAVDPEDPDYSVIRELVAEGVAAASPAPEADEE